MRQLSFLPKQSKVHGGASSIGRRKVMRPFDSRKPMHVILKATGARGERSMLLPVRRAAIEGIRDRAARRHFVRVLRYSNVGNHLHLTVLARHRRHFQAFLREFSGHVAVAMTGAIRGRPAGKFWDALAWTRIVSWGRDLRSLARYFSKNDEQGRERAREAERASVIAFLTECYATAPPG